MTTTLKAPSRNPLRRECQYGSISIGKFTCTQPAIVDCQIPAAGGSWGYLCADHLTDVGTIHIELINNITPNSLNLERQPDQSWKVIPTP